MNSKVVLVTGSSSGIGRTIALSFAKNGCKVVIHGSKSQQKVDEVLDECNKLSPNNNKALGLVIDFSNPDNADTLITKTIEHFGQLDVLVNNAGAYFEPTSQEGNFLYKIYKKTNAINIDSVVNLTYCAIAHLRESKQSPSIIFISSVAGIKPELNSTSYCVSKAAVEMFAKCLAIELAPIVRCNVICPGPVSTPMLNCLGDETINELANSTLLKKLGRQEDIADAATYLSGDKASWITGTTFVIDGGLCLL